jgi:hypothetical protein
MVRKRKISWFKRLTQPLARLVSVRFGNGYESE